MAQSYFIWNGIDCRTKGVTMRGAVSIVRPEERVKHVEIPGRAGDLTVLEGEQIYNSYIQTASISVQGSARVREIYRWLRGDGWVTFSGEPDRRQRARIIGAITLNRVSRNLDRWAGEVQFYCQPLKEKLYAAQTTVTSSGTAVLNQGDVDSRPKVIATASSTSMTLVSGGNTLTLTGITSGTDYVIDSEVMEITNTAGTASYTKNSTGDFPILKPGSNSVTGSGWSSLVIERREKYL